MKRVLLAALMLASKKTKDILRLARGTAKAAGISSTPAPVTVPNSWTALGPGSADPRPS